MLITVGWPGPRDPRAPGWGPEPGLQELPPAHCMTHPGPAAQMTKRKCLQRPCREPDQPMVQLTLCEHIKEPCLGVCCLPQLGTPWVSE